MRNKIKTNPTFPQPSLLPRFNFSASFLSCTFSLSRGAGEQGVLWFIHITLAAALSSSQSFPTPMWAPSSGVQAFTECSRTLWSTNTRSFPGTAVLLELLQCGFFPKASSPEGADCSSGCPTGHCSAHSLLLHGLLSTGCSSCQRLVLWALCRLQLLWEYPPALAWDSPWLWGNLHFSAWNHLLPFLLLWPCCLQGCFFTFFSLLSQLLHSVFTLWWIHYHRGATSMADWPVPVVGLFWSRVRAGSVWCGGSSCSHLLPLKWLVRFGKFSEDNLEHVSCKWVSGAGKVTEGFITQPIYFPFSSPVLCFARKADLMHLIVPQVQPGVQEVLDWSSLEWDIWNMEIAWAVLLVVVGIADGNTVCVGMKIKFVNMQVANIK